MRRKVTLSFILNRYIPAHPVDRYTFKKWDTNDWSRHNENKYFQVKLIVLYFPVYGIFKLIEIRNCAQRTSFSKGIKYFPQTMFFNPYIFATQWIMSDQILNSFICHRFAPLDCKDLGIQSDIVFFGDGQMQIIEYQYRYSLPQRC